MLFLNTVSNSPCSSVQHFLSTAQQVARSLQNRDLCPIWGQGEASRAWEDCWKQGKLEEIVADNVWHHGWKARRSMWWQRLHCRWLWPVLEITEQPSYKTKQELSYCW